MRKKPQGRGRGRGGAPVTKLEPVDSFFNFFSPPKVRTKHAPNAQRSLSNKMNLLEDTGPELQSLPQSPVVVKSSESQCIKSCLELHACLACQAGNAEPADDG